MFMSFAGRLFLSFVLVFYERFCIINFVIVAITLLFFVL